MDNKNLKGMTLNERLYALGLLDRYDEAAARKDRNELLNLLKECELTEQQAHASVEQILNPSSHPSYFKRQSRKLLLNYLFVYPLYYVVAMGVGTLLLWWIYGWSADYAYVWFKISAIGLGLASYAIHWRIGLFALMDSFRK